VPYDTHAFFDKLPDIENVGLEPRPARFEPGQIEEVIGHAGQALRLAVHGADNFLPQLVRKGGAQQ